MSKAIRYRKRILDTLLRDKLKEIGAVLIEGPKQCGKTTTAAQIAKSIVYMADPAERENRLQLARLQPSILLAEKPPLLIDEWQIAPELWDAIRYEVDCRGKSGQFILTGSAVPANREKIFHSGTGRFARLQMRTMSLYESEDSCGAVSISDLFDGHFEAGKNLLTYERVAFLSCRGGWPATLGKPDRAALEHIFDYYSAIVSTDISRASNSRRNSETTKQLMRSLARNQGSSISLADISKDISSNREIKAQNPEIISAYLDDLRKIFVIEDLPAWNPNLRSKTAIRSKATRYFSDPSYFAAALGLGPMDLMKNPETFGFVFEALAIRDLRIYGDFNKASVYHYRDKSGLECDAVMHRRDGQYGLIEIKLGGDEAIEHGAKTLKKLSQKIDTSRMPSPAFLMVLTAVGSYAFRREDGVYVVPIGCLKN